MYAVNRDTGRIGKVIGNRTILIVHPWPCDSNETACEQWDEREVDIVATLEEAQALSLEAHE